MLSVSAKSAKRISSLFSSGSKDDDHNNNNQPRSRARARSQSQTRNPYPNRTSSPNTSPQPGQDSFPPHIIRHSVSAQHLPSIPSASSPTNRNSSAPAPYYTQDDSLPPPPSLAAVNPALLDTSSESRSRRQSLSGNISNIATGFARPVSRGGLRPGGSSEARAAKGRSWVVGKRFGSTDMTEPPPPVPSIMRAWIAGAGRDIPYDINPLTSGDVVPELWDEQGDTFVYLFPQNTGRPPSFKVDSSIFASSPSLTYLARGSEIQSRSRSVRQDPPQLNLPDINSDPMGSADEDDDLNSTGTRGNGDYLTDDSPQELHLYLPVPFDSDVSQPNMVLLDDDVDMLVLFRNLFSFLIGQSLVATPRFPNLFTIFMEIAGLLARFEFSNLDGSSFGETATTSFGCYCDELRLTDIRKSREKTLEAIILGERMRYQPLYYEGFVHGVGKLEDIKRMKSSKYSLISSVTQKRMERGYIDLENRLKTVRGKLEDFDIPSLFAGVANSNMANEAKYVRFKNWKTAYFNFRRSVMSYYRERFGSWPPKASSKKNHFEESGLNRLVLLELYQDLADLYDMLVDRKSLTTRTIDVATLDFEGDSSDPQDSNARALRQVMSEYDRSTPPVHPPVPFDIPLIPNIHSIRRKLDPKKEKKESAKKLSSGDVNELLVGSYNHGSMKPTPFLEFFMAHERRAASGKSCDEIAENRCGQWLFMYAVIQTLPMVVVDAPDVRFADGVEYFLCIPPRGGAPWCKDDSKAARSWFGVAGGSGVVSLPSDVVANGVEGIYRRSHCWRVAARWADEQQMHSPAMLDQVQYPASPVPAAAPPPPPLSSTGSSSDRQGTPLMTPGSQTPPIINLPIPREGSPLLGPPGMGRPGNRSSIHMGLEALPLPAGVTPLEQPSRPVSHNPNMSFDDILRAVPNKKKK